MRVLPNKQIEEWLRERWNGLLDWDSANIQKLAKHDIEVADVESVLSMTFICVGKIEAPEDINILWGEDRFLIIGKHADSRLFAIIWTPRGDRIRVISCRRARPNEKKAYQERFEN